MYVHIFIKSHRSSGLCFKATVSTIKLSFLKTLLIKHLTLTTVEASTRDVVGLATSDLKLAFRCLVKSK